MKKIFDLLIISIILNGYIKSIHQNCFEFSCEECESEEYGRCTKCRDSFVLINGMCPCQDSKCALCNTGGFSENSCILCKNGFYNIDNNCYCNIDNCLQCGKNGCLKCNFGYYYDFANNKCEKINCVDSNCDLCYSTKSNDCYKCKTGYKLESGNCNTQYSTTPCNDNQYEESSYCYEKCDGLACTIEIENKENTYNCNGNDCLFCENNILYSYSNCNNSEMCKGVIEEGCLVCKTDSICSKCNIGYRNENGDCKKCIAGCSICTNDNTCEYCLSGYQLTSDKICILTNNFDYNINVYKIKKQELLQKIYPEEYDDNKIIFYKECDKNCLKCDLNTGKCFECQIDYTLEENICMYNKNCFSRDCNKCSDTGENSCIECKAGKQLINGRCWNIGNNCQDLIPNCALCNGNDKCYACKEKYFLENNTHCEKIKSYLFILYIFIGVIVLGLGVLLIYCIKKKIRQLRLEEEERRRRELERANANSNENTERLNLNNRKQKYEREFDRLESDKSSNHEINDKISSSSEDKKCNICYKTDEIVKRFKCGCSFKVCKECYVQTKLKNNKCPQCRALV